MEQYGLTEQDIEDAFRYGKEELGKITRRYKEYTVNLVTVPDGNEQIVVTCWKYKNWK